MAALAMQTLRGYLALTKPRILLLVIFTGLPVMGMAAGGWPDAGFACATLLALALFRKADHERAGIPMLPNVIGDQSTRWCMLWYTLALVPVTLAHVPLGLRGATYLVAALGLDAWLVWQIVRVLRERSDAAARRAFHVSLAYLFALFLAMLVDRVL